MGHFFDRTPLGEPKALEREGLAKMFTGPEMVLDIFSC
jgi:hypothetical protein